MAKQQTEYEVRGQEAEVGTVMFLLAEMRSRRRMGSDAPFYSCESPFLEATATECRQVARCVDVGCGVSTR